MKRKRESMRRYQQGAVSIFAVIFAALLFTAITVGFTLLMLNDQNRSTDNDLAQSALDSARAGVEDAKRVLAKYNDCKQRNVIATDSGCQQIATAVGSNKCDTVDAALGNPNTQEHKVVQSETDQNLDQAYTCVKIQTNRPDVTGKLEDGQVRVIPLRATNGTPNKVKVSWVKKGTNTTTPDMSPTPVTQNRDGHSVLALPTYDEWKSGANRFAGSVVRAQVIQYNPGDIKIYDVDNESRAAFLYPIKSTAAILPANDISLTGVDAHSPAYKEDGSVNTTSSTAELSANKPKLVQCKLTTGNEYMCSAVIDIAAGAVKPSYLTLAAMYNVTDYKVEIFNGTSQLEFDNVQPRIDATGRANNVFKRIAADVNAGDAADAGLYPRAALGARGSLCKDYTITDNMDEDGFDKGSSGNSGLGCPSVNKQVDAAVPTSP